MRRANAIRHKQSRRPNLEVLERRWVPSCTNNLLEGRLLEIIGDDAGNQVEVADRGSGGVTVSCDDQMLVEGAMVDQVVIRTLGGPDTVNYRLDAMPDSRTEGHGVLAVSIDSGDDADAVRFGIEPSRSFFDQSFAADLGAGDDVFGMFVLPDNRDGDPGGIIPCIRVLVQGGDGGDMFDVTIGSRNPPERDAALPRLNLGLDLTFDGGNGNDSFSNVFANVALQSPGDPSKLSEMGGNGDDSLMMSVFNVFMGEGTMLDANQAGGNGNDVLMNHFDGEISARAVAHFMVDGGAGNDFVTGEIIPCVLPGGLLDVDLLGGLGNDRLALLVREGEISDGAVARFMADGGAGNDFVTSEITPCVLPGGLLDVALLGGLGNDHLALLVREGEISDRAVAHFMLDGGAGNDFVTSEIVPCVLPGGLLDVDLLGGLGNDRLALLVREGEISARAVARFMADGGAGNDFVTSEISPCILPGGLLDVALLGGLGNDRLALLVREGEIFDRAVAHFMVDGGAGNDFVTGEITPCILPGGLLDVDLLGGLGDDRLALLVREGEIFDRAVAHFMVDGGAGNDFMTGEIQPCILPGGLLDVDLLGGLGDDRLAVLVREVREPAETPAGALRMHLDGGEGNDDLTLALDLTLEEFSALDVLVDGGDGIDTASVTENALRFVTNCEKVAVL